MKQNEKDLIARYVYAVTRRIPPKMRDDVAKEIDELITEMMSKGKSIDDVLNELGTPEKFALRYNDKENCSLISGIYFTTYKRVLKITLPIVAICITLASILAICLDQTTNINTFAFWGKSIGQTIGGAIGCTFLTYGIVTFIFSILERNKAFENKNFVNSLPLNPKAKHTKFVVAFSIIAGAIQILGLIICAILYFANYEVGAWITFIVVSAVAIAMYIILTVMAVIHSKRTKKR